MIRSSEVQSSVGCAGSLIGSLKLQAARGRRMQHLHCKPLGRAGDGNPRRILHRILHHILQKIIQQKSSGRSARNGQRVLVLLEAALAADLITASRKIVANRLDLCAWAHGSCYFWHFRISRSEVYSIVSHDPAFAHHNLQFVNFPYMPTLPTISVKLTQT